MPYLFWSCQENRAALLVTELNHIKGNPPKKIKPFEKGSLTHIRVQLKRLIS